MGIQQIKHANEQPAVAEALETLRKLKDELKGVEAEIAQIDKTLDERHPAQPADSDLVFAALNKDADQAESTDSLWRRRAKAEHRQQLIRKAIEEQGRRVESARSSVSRAAYGEVGFEHHEAIQRVARAATELADANAAEQRWRRAFGAKGYREDVLPCGSYTGGVYDVGHLDLMLRSFITEVQQQFELRNLRFEAAPPEPPSPQTKRLFPFGKRAA